MKRTKKAARIIGALLLTLAMAAQVTACQSKGNEGAGEAAAGSYIAESGMPAENPNLNDGVNRVGIAYSNLAAEATQVLIANYEEHYKEYGIDELIILQAENNLQTQIEQVMDLVNQKCDIIIVNAVDSDGLAEVCDQVMAKGIPVMAVDRPVFTDLYYTCMSNNYEIGRDVARAFCMMSYEEGMGDGAVKVLKCVNGTTSAAVRDRLAGVDDELALWSHVRLVGEPSIEFDIEKTYNAVIDAFTADPDIDVVYVSGGNYVAPVVSALDELGLLKPYGEEGHVIIASIDGTATELNGILAGQNDISGVQRFDLFGSKILEACQNYFNGIYVDSYNDEDLEPGIITTPWNIENLKAKNMLWGIH